ncbi:DUF5681 domain-containing protein [Sphingomonas sp. AR_OL41]|uniref:DUF5681 domain-containing protein n=1 Tax=Sphingomonas sp. AR_OL41 TaxID=3042729 RepID=UPI002480DDC3|nr:DUF5681 domain-containing protein [Sphingomonas sp. AR_OL41]MDH7972179.1 DUF5681 domain-containing protein [Sphingomonas sp. AR_OL41]
MTQRGNGITAKRQARRGMLREVQVESEVAAGADGDGAGADAAAWRTGNCRPPIAYRFKPGQSGNPAGRPRRGATGAPGDRLPGAHEPTKAMILEEAYRMVTMRIGEEEQELAMNRAVFRALGAAAIAGNRVAQRQWVRMVREAEAEQRRDQIAVHNAVVWPIAGATYPNGRGNGADYADEIIVDWRSKVAVVRAVEGEREEDG